ncbi:MAG: 4Fe-4S binding protein [Thermodesulfobacteriota bacterium]|nr:4Fe-4S binding protein [Thermodesulfobacteriota bacterium]
MKQATITLRDHLVAMRKWDKPYKALRKHLNKQPVGYPATLTGVERRLLKAMFTVDEARLALYMDWQYKTADTIFEKAGHALQMSGEDVCNMLSVMEKNGAIAAREVDGTWEYALHPLVIGMYEMQLPKFTPTLYLDARKYMVPVFCIEYLSSAIPQTRVVPVEKSVTPEHNTATYDEIRNIIENADSDICIAECICRKAKASLGEPCKVTDRKEACLGLGDFGAQFLRNGSARKITKKEVMEHLDLCEKEGLVIQPSNEMNPEYYCFCCGCCCGILEMMRTVPRPVDFCASNFYAVLDTSACNGCGRCVKRCQMGAITIKDKKAVLNTSRCIGCGLCVTTCKTGSLQLVKKETETVPPGNMEAKFAAILAGKKGTMGKLASTVKGAWGFKP